MAKKYRRGLYALSGDPVHNGHLDVISRAAADFCDELVVVVAVNSAKKCIFALEERLAMVKRAVVELGLKNVKVISYPGLTVDVYLREGCDVLIRGVRNEADIAYEKALAQINGLLLLKGVQVEMIPAEDDLLRMVSSSMVKEIVMHHGPTEKLVPMFVKQALEERLLSQRLVAVTGQIATGKGWVAKMLAERAKARGLKATYLNVDELIRELYEEASEGAELVREELAGAFGPEVLDAGRTVEDVYFRTVDRKALSDAIFAPDPCGGDHIECVRQRMERATDITKDHVRRLLREKLRTAEGIVIMEWAQLAEMQMGRWMNNNAVIVHSEQREHFIAERKIPAERLAVLNALQWEPIKKLEALASQAQADRSGTVLLYENHIDIAAVEAAKNGGEKKPSADSEGAIDKLFDKIVNEMFPALAKK